MRASLHDQGRKGTTRTRKAFPGVAVSHLPPAITFLVCCSPLLVPSGQASSSKSAITFTHLTTLRCNASHGLLHQSARQGGGGAQRLIRLGTLPQKINASISSSLTSPARVFHHPTVILCIPNNYALTWISSLF